MPTQCSISSGGETQTRSFQVLRPGGKLISNVSQPDQDRAKHHGVTAAFFLVEVTTERLRRISDLIDRDELKTRVGAVLSPADAREAHMMLEGRRPRPRGKIILNVEAAGESPQPLEYASLQAGVEKGVVAGPRPKNEASVACGSLSISTDPEPIFP
jgi:hypothetical protein